MYFSNFTTAPVEFKSIPVIPAQAGIHVDFALLGSKQNG
jgi:hypothetical protein